MRKIRVKQLKEVFKQVFGKIPTVSEFRVFKKAFIHHRKYHHHEPIKPELPGILTPHESSVKRLNWWQRIIYNITKMIRR